METRDYDIAGNVVLYKDGNQHGTTFEYNGDGAKVYAFATKTTDALGHAATAAYDYGIGRAAWVGDVNNTYTFFDRSASDGLDRVTGTRVVSGGSTLRQSTFSYPDPNTVITKSDLNTAGDLAMQAVTLYDGLGRATTGRSYESAGGYIETATGYDALGRVVSQTDPSRSGPGAATTSGYDALGRVLSVTHQDGTVATNAYSGYATTSMDESGAAKRVVYDWAGRIATVFEDPAGLRYGTNYLYDALDNLKVVSQGYCPACQGRAFRYDGLSRLKNANNAESGITSYVYDAAGNVTSRTDARSITTTYGYDAVNRPTAKSASDGSLNVSWSYDSGTYGLGRLSAVTSSAGTTSYAYDAQGQVVASTQETAGQSYAFSYGYNAAGGLTSETYPSGRVATQTYDVLDRVTGVTGSKNAVTTNYGVVLGYAPHGAVQSMRYGNAVETDLEYDAQLRQNANIAQTNNNLYLYAIRYQTWAGNGNLANSEAYEGGYGQFLSLSHFTQSYSYDQVNRLTGVTDSGGYYSRSYGYDQYGNMSVTGNSGLPWSGLTPYSGAGSNPFSVSTNRLNAGGYDAAGNQTMLGSLQLGYDADNRQVLSQDGSNVTGYSYDGNGKRVLKGGSTIGTTVYVYDAFNRLAAEYVDGATVASPCQTCYLSTDYLGSVRLVTNETGTTVGLHDYLPFGEEIPANTAGRDGTFGGFENVRQRFTGQERDETNLDFFEARYSAATLGRFLSPDPANAGADLLNPQSWNGYSYVVNNPLNSTDPTGLFELQNPKPAPDPGPDPGDFFNYCFVFSCGPGGFGFGGGSIPTPAPMFLPPVKTPFRTGGDGSQPPKNGTQQVKQAYCSAIPAGRSTSASVALGVVGAVSGELDTVFNYNSGQTSVFATGGVSAGWNGGLSLTVSSGLVYGLDQTNSGFSGAFKGASLYVPTPIPGVSGGGSVIGGGGVTVISAGASAGLVGRYGGGISATTTSRPVNTGRFTGFSLPDLLGYLLRRPCN